MESSLPTFLAIRPLTAGEFVMAKMKMAASSTSIFVGFQEIGGGEDLTALAHAASALIVPEPARQLPRTWPQNRRVAPLSAIHSWSSSGGGSTMFWPR